MSQASTKRRQSCQARKRKATKTTTKTRTNKMSIQVAVDHQPQSPSGSRPIQASAADRLKILHPIPAAEGNPRWIWLVRQWKYDVDKASTWLKRAYFHYVFLPFSRFSYWAFDLAPFNGRDETDRLCFTEYQGCWDTEWEAEQDAKLYPYGHAIRVPLRASLPCVTVLTEQVHPNSPPEVRAMYEKKVSSTTIEVPKLALAKLAERVASSDRFVEQYQASKQ